VQARGLSSAMSAASSACDHIRDWVMGTPEGSWVSMGVYSDGSYGQPEGLIYSFPVTCKDGKWSIVQVGSECCLSVLVVVSGVSVKVACCVERGGGWWACQG
jgi:malate/lactate dehydrogenase